MSATENSPANIARREWMNPGQHLKDTDAHWIQITEAAIAAHLATIKGSPRTEVPLTPDYTPADAVFCAHWGQEPHHCNLSEETRAYWDRAALAGYLAHLACLPKDGPSDEEIHQWAAKWVTGGKLAIPELRALFAAHQAAALAAKDRKIATLEPLIDKAAEAMGVIRFLAHHLDLAGPEWHENHGFGEKVTSAWMDKTAESDKRFEALKRERAAAVHERDEARARADSHEKCAYQHAQRSIQADKEAATLREQLEEAKMLLARARKETNHCPADLYEAMGEAVHEPTPSPAAVEENGTAAERAIEEAIAFGIAPRLARAMNPEPTVQNSLTVDPASAEKPTPRVDAQDAKIFHSYRTHYEQLIPLAKQLEQETIALKWLVSSFESLMTPEERATLAKLKEVVKP